MAQLKKNQLNQIMFPMVLATDFATIKSTLGAASVAGKFYGVNNGGSAAMTSGTISKAASLVRSGIFRQTLKAAETNYDFLLFRFTATSMADQVLTFMAVDNDDSDLLSALTVIQSMASDAASAAAQGNSRALLMISTLSDLFSQLSDFRSDIKSHMSTTGIQLNASTMSDLRSAIAAGPAGVVTTSDISDIASGVWAHIVGARVDSRVLLIQSMASDAASAAAQGNSRILVVQSIASDVQSAVALVLSLASDVDSALTSRFSDLLSLLTTTGIQLNASSLSDLRSAITAGPAATVTASDISDIASAVRAALVSDLSDILSAAVQANSRVILVQSRLSDFDSRLVSDISDIRSMLTYLSGAISDVGSNISDFLSDFQSRITGVVATASDVASKVWAEKYTAASNVKASTFGSLLRLNQSRISDVQSYLVAMSAVLSDVYSQVSDFRSDLHSFVSTTGVNIGGSAISDLGSQVWANVIGARVDSRVRLLQSDVSDATSAAQQVNSRVLVAQSLLSDIYSNLVAGVLIGASGLSDIGSRVWADTIGARVDSRVLVIKSAASDAASGASDLRSLIETTGVKVSASDMSDLRSAIAAGPAATVTASDISDIASAVWAITAGAAVASRVLVIKSQASDIYSLLSDALSAGVKVTASDMSDLRSAITAGPTGALTVSDISDIASRVRAVLDSDLSDALSGIRANASQLLLVKSLASDAASAAAQANSRALVLVSLASDIDSALTSQYTAGQALTASAISDVASAVWADTIGARVDSRLRLVQSTASDAASAAQQANSRVLLVESLVSDIDSALTSRASDILSHLTVLESMASDAASAAQQANSRILVTQSIVSDVQSAVVLVKAKTDNLPSAVKKNTQLSNFEFLMIDAADHITPKTGLTVTSTRSIDGAAFGACANAAVEVSNGIYRITLAAADLNGDVITVRFNSAGADDRFLTFLTKA